MPPPLKAEDLGCSGQPIGRQLLAFCGKKLPFSRRPHSGHCDASLKTTAMTSKSPILQRLDEVQGRLAELLTPVGFARKGRAFKRETESGIFQIIALQAGRFELGPPLPDPVKHWRPDNYGEFTVNIGVYVEEMFERTNPPRNPKRVIDDAHCSIRTRLSGITDNDDQWWSLMEDCNDLADDIGALLLHVGIPFLQRFSSREQIVRDWISFNETDRRLTQVARLDVAMVLLKNGDRDGARRLFQQHLGRTELPHHAVYVRKLADELGLGVLDEG